MIIMTDNMSPISFGKPCAFKSFIVPFLPVAIPLGDSTALVLSLSRYPWRIEAEYSATTTSSTSRVKISLPRSRTPFTSLSRPLSSTFTTFIATVYIERATALKLSQDTLRLQKPSQTIVLSLSPSSPVKMASSSKSPVPSVESEQSSVPTSPTSHDRGVLPSPSPASASSGLVAPSALPALPDDNDESSSSGIRSDVESEEPPRSSEMSTSNVPGAPTSANNEEEEDDDDDEIVGHEDLPAANQTPVQQELDMATLERQESAPIGPMPPQTWSFDSVPVAVPAPASAPPPETPRGRGRHADPIFAREGSGEGEDPRRIRRVGRSSSLRSLARSQSPTLPARHSRVSSPRPSPEPSSGDEEEDVEDVAHADGGEEAPEQEGGEGEVEEEEEEEEEEELPWVAPDDHYDEDGPGQEEEEEVDGLDPRDDPVVQRLISGLGHFEQARVEVDELEGLVPLEGPMARGPPAAVRARAVLIQGEDEVREAFLLQREELDHQREVADVAQEGLQQYQDETRRLAVRLIEAQADAAAAREQALHNAALLEEARREIAALRAQRRQGEE